ncbi:MAG: hypothetical protein C0506_12240, partial [Anaerolinea sp.]|nr:hypothetical protein [Anaerolinea sp.]
MDSSELIPIQRLVIAQSNPRARRVLDTEFPADVADLANSNRCFNCGELLVWEPTPPPSSRRWLFCTQHCQQQAKYVRYFRSTAKDGRQTDPGVLYELKIKRAHVLNGGYPADERRLSPETRAFVVKRDAGQCVECGGQGTEIDHLEPLDGPALNAPANLQLLCKDCHWNKTARNLVPVSPADTAAHATLARLAARCDAVTPLSFADDQERWETWRPKLTSYRRARYLS